MPSSTGAGTASKSHLDHAVTRSLLSGGTLFRNSALETGPLLFPDDSGGAGASGEGDGNGAEGNGSEDGDNDDGETPEDVTGLKSALAKVREERKQAKADAKALKDRLDALEKQQRDADEEKRKADDDKQKEQGKFKELAESREKERDEAKSELTTVREQNDKLTEAMKTGVEARWTELPEAVRKLGEKQHPEDDVLGRWTFLNDSDTAALVKELTDKTETKRGNGADPKGSGGGTPELKSLITKQQAGFSG